MMTMMMHRVTLYSCDKNNNNGTHYRYQREQSRLIETLDSKLSAMTQFVTTFTTARAVQRAAKIFQAGATKRAAGKKKKNNSSSNGNKEDNKEESKGGAMASVSESEEEKHGGAEGGELQAVKPISSAALVP